MPNTPQQQAQVDWYKSLGQAAGQGFDSTSDLGDIDGFTKTSDGTGGFTYSDASGNSGGNGSGTAAPASPSGSGGGAASGGTPGGAKIVDPGSSPSPSMDALQSAGSGDMGAVGGAESLGAPSAFRQGIGKRIYPQESAALASLRKVY